uniref:Protein FAM98A-like n=1 Tax=Hirondellea gigas TaxID=1518452 RepID=A0A2P2IG78_9CRUS
MKFMLLSCLLAVAAAMPQNRGYEAPSAAPPANTYNTPPSNSYEAPVSCPPGQVPRGDGSCATPIVTRNLFLYDAPAVKVTYGPAPDIPDPRVYYNLVFIRTPLPKPGPKPIVAPPPQQKTVVYILNKRPEPQEHEVIEIDVKPTQPEVYFVNYNEGENVDLPGGIDLKTALSQSVNDGEIIDGSDGDDDSSDGGFSGPSPPSPPSKYY